MAVSKLESGGNEGTEQLRLNTKTYKKEKIS